MCEVGVACVRWGVACVRWGVACVRWVGHV